MKSYKNSSSTNYRQETNRRTIDQAFSGDIECAIYAKVVSKMGEGRMKILYEDANNANKGYEGIAKIRGILRKKGQVPIQTDDIVIITPRTFEKVSKNFDLIGVLSSKDVSDLKKKSDAPSFLTEKQQETFDFVYENEVKIEDI